MEDSSVQLSGIVPEWLKGRKGQDPSCIGVMGADRGCEGPHDGPPEGRVNLLSGAPALRGYRHVKLLRFGFRASGGVKNTHTSTLNYSLDCKKILLKINHHFPDPCRA